MDKLRMKIIFQRVQRMRWWNQRHIETGDGVKTVQKVVSFLQTSIRLRTVIKPGIPMACSREIGLPGFLAVEFVADAMYRI
jgi:hypothetical protein